MSRDRDLLFDALTEALRLNVPALTQTERGRVNKSLKELRAVGATPEQIKARTAEYRRLWPKITCTARGLAANWSKLGPAPVDQVRFLWRAIKTLEEYKREDLDGTPRRSSAELFYARLTVDQQADPQVTQLMGWFRRNDVPPQLKLRLA